MPRAPGRRDFLCSASGLASALLLPSLGCGDGAGSGVRQRPKALARPSSGLRADPSSSASSGDFADFAEHTAPGSDLLPDGLDPDNFTIYTRTPLTLETLRSRLPSAAITETGRLFVRNNLPMPHPQIVANADAWRIEVTGVQDARSFTLRELKELGQISVVAVLQCSGNGRRFFPHGPSGSPWGVGAAGSVRWTGVPVSAVLEAVGGALPTARFLTATGGDPLPKLPPGITPEMLLVERSIPLKKGLADALLAWELNGEPIPLSHGGPLRLIVPGYYGVNNIKYVKTLACTKDQSGAKIQETSYRLRPLGEPGATSQPSMWRMVVKSWIGEPGADDAPVIAGPQTIRGVAFSGERGVKEVEVSIDGGRSWLSARLDAEDHGVNAWRPFSLDVELGVGAHELVSRATDTQGERQPEHRQENERGYGNNSWRDMALPIEVFATSAEALAARERRLAAQPRPTPTERSAAAELSPQAARGREVFVSEADPACGNCHTLADAGAGMKIGPNLDNLGAPVAKVQNAVTNGVGVMQGYRDRLSPEQIDAVAHYVAEAARK